MISVPQGSKGGECELSVYPALISATSTKTTDFPDTSNFYQFPPYPKLWGNFH